MASSHWLQMLNSFAVFAQNSSQEGARAGRKEKKNESIVKKLGFKQKDLGKKQYPFLHSNAIQTVECSECCGGGQPIISLWLGCVGGYSEKKSITEHRLCFSCAYNINTKYNTWISSGKGDLIIVNNSKRGYFRYVSLSAFTDIIFYWQLPIPQIAFGKP